MIPSKLLNMYDYRKPQRIQAYNNQDMLEFCNPIKFEHIRNGKVIGTYYTKNGVTNEGKNYILNAGFFGGTQVLAAGWYMGLINNAGSPTLAAADVMNSHAGWTEWTSYSQGTRVAWGPGTSTAQSTTNAVACTFDITALGTLYGIFITSGSAKSGTTGTLWATGGFASTIPVDNTDQFKGSYTIGC